ncbi:hypothetical protein [Sporocytophaga myxococcoides]|uniref:hypothetical protein n=1 Tax=Sporocytophaga myxococcoides TaxID=153721 RepID=UPI00041DC5BE|nr:hypothetical protein [Sporocytophaga myxococcoides]
MKIKIYFLLVIFCVSCHKDKEEISFPGFQRFFELPLSCQGEIAALQLPDDSYLIATDNKEGNVYLLKISKEGKPLSETSFGTQQPEEVKSIFKNANGNYIVAGTTINSTNNYIFIWEFNDQLQLVKNYGYGGVSYLSKLIYITETAKAGTYLLVGEMSVEKGKKVISVETDLKNSTTPKELIIQDFREGIQSVFQTPNSELLWTGYFTDGNFTNISLIKSDLQCNFDWNLNYTSFDDRNQVGYGTIANKSGELFICGSNQSDQTGIDFFIAKATVNGKKIKEYTYERPTNQYPKSIMQMNGEIFIAGSTEENGTRDILVVKANADLIPTGQKIIGSSSHDEAKLILATEDGSLLLLAKVSIGTECKLAAYKIKPEEVHF